MNPARELLTELEAAGVTLTRHGDRLRLAPPQAVRPALLARVREHKAGILLLLPEPASLICYTCKGRDFWQGEPVHYTDSTKAPAPWVCSRCHPRPEGERKEAG